MPDADFLSLALAEQGLELTPERLELVRAGHERLRPAREALRAVPLAFTGAVVEPASAQAWVERGGVTP